MAIAWEAKYKLGIEVIDLQHEQFVATLNHLYDAVMTSQVPEQLTEIFDQLIAYKDIHFATEEKYFDQFHYPDAEEHKQKHQFFSQKILELQKEFLSGQKEVALKLTDYLVNWLLTHISVEDKEYVECFHQHNLF
jgi:hemerythrin